MHIVIVTNRLITGEGQGRVNLELARAAAAAGHTVTCLAYRVDNRLLMMPNVEWVHMPDANAPTALLGNIRFARASTRWIRRFGNAADVIVANGANTWAPVDVNIVHFVHTAWRKSSVHDLRLQRNAYGAYQWLYSSLGAAMETRLLPRAGRVISVSEKVRDELIDAGLPASKVGVIHNGVDIEEFAPGDVDRTALGLPEDVPLGLFVGDIRTKRKGLDVVIQSLVNVADVHIAVAGRVEGSPYPAVAQSLGVADRVHFLDFRNDIPDLMRAADLFTFPSRYEACSLVLLEALGAGLPILTARTAGGAELVTGEAGIVLDDPDDQTAFDNALRRLAIETRASRKRSRAARAIAEKNSWGVMARHYLDLFEGHVETTPNVPSVAV
jgi:glycosyltransferase involved in cell wall biosynthesis